MTRVAVVISTDWESPNEKPTKIGHYEITTGTGTINGHWVDKQGSIQSTGLSFNTTAEFTDEEAK